MAFHSFRVSFWFLGYVRSYFTLWFVEYFMWSQSEIKSNIIKLSETNFEDESPVVFSPPNRLSLVWKLVTAIMKSEVFPTQSFAETLLSRCCLTVNVDPCSLVREEPEWRFGDGEDSYDEPRPGHSQGQGPSLEQTTSAYMCHARLAGKLRGPH